MHVRENYGAYYPTLGYFRLLSPAPSIFVPDSRSSRPSVAFSRCIVSRSAPRCWSMLRIHLENRCAFPVGIPN